MIEVSEEQFEKLVGRAMDSLVKQMSEVKNVGIVIADDPTPEQRVQLQFRHS